MNDISFSIVWLIGVALAVFLLIYSAKKGNKEGIESGVYILWVYAFLGVIMLWSVTVVILLLITIQIIQLKKINKQY